MREMIVSGVLLAMLVIGLNGCGETSSNANIDRASYYEKESTINNWISIFEDKGREFRREIYYEEKVLVEDQTIIYESNNSNYTAKVTINSNDINLTYPENPDLDQIEERYVPVGGVIWSKFSSSTEENNGITRKESKKEACIVEAKTNSFEGDPDFLSINYEGEILVETCTTYMEVFYKDTNKTMNYIDVKQYYSQKGKSQIASINKNCYVKDDNNESNFILNDESETCIESTTYSTFMLE